MDKISERNVTIDHRDDGIIDLGVASVETKGDNPMTRDDSPAFGGLQSGMLVEE